MRKSTHTGEYARLRASLIKARQGAGLSQRELARKLVVPHTWVAKVESGERRIDLVELVWFYSTCGTDPTLQLTGLLQEFVALPVRTRRGGR